MPSLVSKTLTAVRHKQRHHRYVAFIILVVPCAKRFGAVQHNVVEGWAKVRISLDKLVDLSDFASSGGWQL